MCNKIDLFVYQLHMCTCIVIYLLIIYIFLLIIYITYFIYLDIYIYKYRMPDKNVLLSDITSILYLGQVLLYINAEINDIQWATSLEVRA